jgi:eukaryotic-like serine/threonine-protein kinase
MIGAVLNDRHRLDAELGRGGMGVVYQARDLLLDRDVAVKVLSAGFPGAEGRARLLREARSAARLNRPNIVSIYDAGETTMPGISDPLPLIVMELVAGPSLHLRRPDSLPLAETLRLAGQVCAALEHAHPHGIVHRGLKPENVLLAPGSASESATAKLNDLGLARSMASRLTTESGCLRHGSV